MCKNLKRWICSIFQESQVKKKTRQQQRKLKQPKRAIILVLEDNRDFQEAAKKALQDLPYKVAITSNGKGGLDYLRKNGNKVAVILLDIMMPIMDGLKFLSIVKRDSDLKEIPIIIQSSACAETIKKAMALGANSSIPKPFTKKMVLAAIKKLNIKKY